MQKRPILPYLLGIAGLIPFVYLGATSLLAEDPRSASVINIYLAGYGAVILSFLGGTRWGAELQRRPDNPDKLTLGLAMLPSLAGWAAILPIMWDRWFLVFGLLAAGLLLQLAWDIAAIRRGEFPAWYLPLRVLLTGIAVPSLVAAALF